MRAHLTRPRLNPAFKRFQNLPNLSLEIRSEAIHAAPVCLSSRSRESLSLEAEIRSHFKDGWRTQASYELVNCE